MLVDPDRPAVAVCGTATLETVIAVAAALRTGVPVVPVPADAGPTERGHILRDSGAALVIGEPDDAAAAPDATKPSKTARTRRIAMTCMFVFVLIEKVAQERPRGKNTLGNRQGVARVRLTAFFEAPYAWFWQPFWRPWQPFAERDHGASDGRCCAEQRLRPPQGAQA